MQRECVFPRQENYVLRAVLCHFNTQSEKEDMYVSLRSIYFIEKTNL